MKVLIVRFSSIGDIVLTTPIVRCLKQQVNNVEVHYLTKDSFKSVLDKNPYIDFLHTIKNDLSEIIPTLKKENFDYVVDLHRNFRTLKLKKKLGVKSFSYNKLNWEKFLLTFFKINKLPNTHIVNRYFKTIESLGFSNDNKGLDYFIDSLDEVNIKEVLPIEFMTGFNALVVGGSYFTKQIPQNKLNEICLQSKLPLVLLGGKDDFEIAESVFHNHKNKTINLCGKLKLNQSASIIKQSVKVITSDTGLMHIAAAYKKDIISVWGNTIPEFGMGPYLAGEESQIIEVKNLSCRPCSKLGYKKCPKGHFKCMNDLDFTSVRF